MEDHIEELKLSKGLKSSIKKVKKKTKEKVTFEDINNVNFERKTTTEG